VKNHILTARIMEVQPKPPPSWLWEVFHQTLSVQRSQRCPCPTHRQDTENVHHYLAVEIRARWRGTAHTLTPLLPPPSLQLCSKTQHAADIETIPILIIPCPEAICKCQEPHISSHHKQSQTGKRSEKPGPKFHRGGCNWIINCHFCILHREQASIFQNSNNTAD